MGLVTLRVMSRPGRITQPGHVMTIVRNVAGAEATSTVGRVRMLVDRKGRHGGAPLVSSPTSLQ